MRFGGRIHIPGFMEQVQAARPDLFADGTARFSLIIHAYDEATKEGDFEAVVADGDEKFLVPLLVAHNPDAPAQWELDAEQERLARARELDVFKQARTMIRAGRAQIDTDLQTLAMHQASWPTYDTMAELKAVLADQGLILRRLLNRQDRLIEAFVTLAKYTWQHTD